MTDEVQSQLAEGLHEQFDLTLLHESPENPRSVTDERFDALKYSLSKDEEMMPARPIIATVDGEIVCGNIRHRALGELGRATAPVFIKRFETNAQKREWMLRDNQEYGEWVPAELAALIAAQREEGADLSLLGFDDAETDSLLRLHDSLGDEPPEEEEPPASEPLTKAGEIWELGPHRLAVGSALDSDLVHRLLAASPLAPKLLVTDPPFGVNLEMEWRDDAGFNSERFLGAKDVKPAVRGRKPSSPAETSYLRDSPGGVSDDVRADWSEAYELVPSLRVALVWHADRHIVPVITGLERIGFRFVQQIIWDKEVLVLSRTIYHFRHEPASLFVRYQDGEPAPRFYGKQDQHTIWAAVSPKRLGSASDEDKLAHPTQKPMLLFETPIRNHLARGECAYDPFVGSGTAIMAANRSDRVCLGVELNPAYADIAIERFTNATGIDAVRA